jgi:streptogramin lyase
MKSRSVSALGGSSLRLTLLLAMMAAVGCGSGGNGSQSPLSGGVPMAISGAVHGGQNPVAGAAVFVYQAGSAGYGRGDVKLACTTTVSNGQFSFGSTAPLCAGTGLPAAFSCPAAGSPNLYLLAVAGNPGAGSNAALVMMTALGPCNGVVANGFVTINEVTTVASVWALSQFMNCGGGGLDAPVTGCAANSRDAGASPTNALGLGNAMALAGNLANLSKGVAQGSGGGTAVPSAEINTLADLLQDCVNSTGAASTACNNLFTCAVPGAKPGAANSAPCALPTGAVVPADTLAAALDIARNPANNVAALFNLTSKTPAFSPTLSTAPRDWTISFNYAAGSGLSNPVAVAIDSRGDAWVANSTGSPARLTEIGPTGAFLSGLTGFGDLVSPASIAIDPTGIVWVADPIALGTGGVTYLAASGDQGKTFGGPFNMPQAIAVDGGGNAWAAGTVVTVVTVNGPGLPFNLTGGGLTLAGGIAIDGAGNIWISNINSNTITELTPAGVFLSLPAGYPGGTLNEPAGIAIDPVGNVWVANVKGSSISELSSSGAVMSPLAGFMGGGLNNPHAIAIDAAGNVWVANTSGNSLIELSPAGNFLSPPGGFSGNGLANPLGIAIDAAGDLWLPNQTKQSVTEFVGAATPVLTPMSACLQRNTGHAVCLP